jgi:molecular chaperone DnaK
MLSEELPNNLELVKGDLTGLPRKPAGQPLEVSFELGADGILHVSAVAGNGKVLKLEAKISGLLPDEVKQAPLPAIQR